MKENRLLSGITAHIVGPASRGGRSLWRENARQNQRRGEAAHLNGIGLRTKLIFKVYVAGLYAEVPSKNAAQMITSDQIRQVKMVMLRDLGAARLPKLWRMGSKATTRAQMLCTPGPAGKIHCSASGPQERTGTAHHVRSWEGNDALQQRRSPVTVPGKDFAGRFVLVWLWKRIAVYDGLKKVIMGLAAFRI